MWKKIIIDNQETNYSVSDTGLVKNDVRGNFMTNSLQQGYLHVGLTINGKMKRMKVHRLVALMFIPNPENKPYVNHINGKKDDNRLENLEWVTAAENTRHAYKIGLAKPTVTRPVRCYDMQGNKLKDYNSLTEAARDTNSSDEKICDCCKGYRESHNKYQWRYLDEAADKLSEVKSKTYAKKVAQIKDGKVLAIYNSYKEAARAVGGTSSAISRVISGTKQTKTHKGFEWKLVEEIVQ